MFPNVLEHSLEKEKDDVAFYYSTWNRVSLLEKIKVKTYSTSKG